MENTEWLEDGKALYDTLAAQEADRAFRLTIRSSDDEKEDYHAIKSLTLSWDGDESVDIGVLLANIIKTAPNLSELIISRRGIDWKTLCSLDLSNVTSLSATIKGLPGMEKLVAPKLMKLNLSGYTNLGPLELLAAPLVSIDCSALKNLEELHVRHIAPLDPECFANLQKLKILHIVHAHIGNLSWLETATYQLNALFIEGSIHDCSGITNQQELTSVSIDGAILDDIQPFLHLNKLARLKLSRARLPINGEKLLKSSNIEKVIVSKRDEAIESLFEKVRWLLFSSVRCIRSEDKKLATIETLPEPDKKRILFRTRQPFENRLKWHLEIAYNTKFERIQEKDYAREYITKEESIELFQEMAKARYPFIFEKKDAAAIAAEDAALMERYLKMMNEMRNKKGRS